MKKALIAGAASAVLASMPVISAFAAPVATEYSNIDEIVTTVTAQCAMTMTAASGGVAITDNSEPAKTLGYTYTVAAITPGQASTDIEGTTMNVKCNNSAGWTLQAVGSGTVTGDATKMKSSTDVAADDIPTGNTFNDSSVSNWGFKIASVTGTTGTIQGSYASYQAVPSSATSVVSYATPTDMTNGVTIVPNYKIAIKSTQAAGTYTGRITYTLAQPAA